MPEFLLLDDSWLNVASIGSVRVSADPATGEPSTCHVTFAGGGGLRIDGPAAVKALLEYLRKNRVKP